MCTRAKSKANDSEIQPTINQNNNWLSLILLRAYLLWSLPSMLAHLLFLYEVDVLHIGLNELSAGLDTVFGMLLFLYGLFETLF